MLCISDYYLMKVDTFLDALFHSPIHLSPRYFNLMPFPTLLPAKLVWMSRMHQNPPFPLQEELSLPTWCTTTTTLCPQKSWIHYVGRSSPLTLHQSSIAESSLSSQDQRHSSILQSLNDFKFPRKMPQASDLRHRNHSDSLRDHQKCVTPN